MTRVRSGSFVGLLLVLVMLGVLVYMAAERGQTLRERYAPPIRYEQQPEPVSDPVCPGDTIIYAFALTVLPEGVPVAFTVYRGVWSVSDKRFVVGDPTGKTYPYNHPAFIERSSAYTLPERMDDGKAFPAGEYRLEVVGESEGRASVGFSVPFTLKSC